MIRHPAPATLTRPGRAPTVVFLPGYASTMTGTKAEHLDGWAARTGHALTRFDYAGCGASPGRFLEGTIARWTADALAALGTSTGPAILVGSSMGGWIALLAAIARPERVRGLLLLAPAPDFPRWGLRPTAAERAQLATHGHVTRTSPYGPDPTSYSAAFIADAPRHELLHAPIAVTAPVRILHGLRDPDVPPRISRRLLARLASTDVHLTLVKDGDHRLSRAPDLALMTTTLEGLIAICSA